MTRFQTLKALTGALVLSAFATGLAQADVTSTDYTGASGVVMEDFIATVSVTVGTGDTINVTIDDRDGDKEPVLVEQQGDTIRVFSRNEPDDKMIWRQLNWQRDGSEAFRNFLKDYPVVQITLPAGTDITTEDLAAYVTIGDIMGDLTVESTIYMEGTVGDLTTADINITGAGDLRLADVAETMRGRIAGSGSLNFDTVGSAEIGIAGSGDVDVNNVEGPAEVSIRGSGDVTIDDIAGDAELNIAGSGDIVTGMIGGGLEIAIRGSGDIEVAGINGPASVDIVGNGDVEIREGNALGMLLNISGSGDFEFGGIAQDPEVSVRGSGDVYIRDYTGRVKTNGSGDITIGNIVIDD